MENPSLATSPTQPVQTLVLTRTKRTGISSETKKGKKMRNGEIFSGVEGKGFSSRRLAGIGEKKMKKEDPQLFPPNRLARMEDDEALVHGASTENIFHFLTRQHNQQQLE